MSLKIHHVAFAVQNLDKSVAWYASTFGTEVTDRYKKHGVEIAQLLTNGIHIELFSSDNIKSLPSYRRTLTGDIQTVGTKHVCIETDNLDSFCEKLKEQGVKFATAVDEAHFGGRYVFIEDPDGILIELYQS